MKATLQIEGKNKLTINFVDSDSADIIIDKTSVNWFFSVIEFFHLMKRGISPGDNLFNSLPHFDSLNECTIPSFRNKNLIMFKFEPYMKFCNDVHFDFDRDIKINSFDRPFEDLKKTHIGYYSSVLDSITNGIHKVVSKGIDLVSISPVPEIPNKNPFYERYKESISEYPDQIIYGGVGFKLIMKGTDFDRAVAINKQMSLYNLL